MNIRRHIFLIFLFSLICILPAYLFGFGGHDAHIRGLWTKHFARLLAEGHIYPRLANDMFAGFGSYVFFFYPPVSLYFSSLFAFLGKDYNLYYSTTSASANLALFLSGVAAYYWLKSKITADHALLFALLYMVLPMHLAVDFYITAALAQFWAYVWLPLILYGIDKISRNEKYGLPVFAVSLALLVTTHIPLSIIFIPAALIYGTLILGRNSWRLIPGCLLALALTAVYTLPMLSYQNLVNIDLHWFRNGGVYYSDFFLDKELFSADAKEGYRLVVLLQGLLTYIPLIFLLSQIPAGRMKNLMMIGSGLVLFLCFSFSDFIWQIFSPLQLIQFPRRLVVIPTVLIIISAANLSDYLHEKNRKIVTVLIAIFLISGWLIAAGRSADMQGNEVLALKKDFAHDIEAYPHYLPGKDLIANFYPLSPQLANYPQAKIDKGSVVIRKWQSRDIEMKISAKAGAILKVRQVYFPYWRAYNADREIPISRDERGIISIEIDKDISDEIVQLKLETLPAERLGIWLSSLGSILLFFMIIRDARKKPL